MTVVPLVIGALGSVSDMFEKYMGKLDVTIRIEDKRSKKLFCWEQLDYYGKFCPFRDSGEDPLGPLGTCCFLLSRVIDNAKYTFYSATT